MQNIRRYSRLFDDLFDLSGCTPTEAVLYARLYALSEGQALHTSVIVVAARCNISRQTAARTLEKMADKGLLIVVWQDMKTKKNCCIQFPDIAQNRAQIAAVQNGHKSVQNGQKTVQNGQNIIVINNKRKEKEEEKEINKEKDEVNDQIIDAETAAARDRALASIERLMQQTKDPTGQKQRARAIREEIRHAPVVANASTINIRSGAAYQLTNNMQGGEGAIGPTTTGNAEADKILAQAYRYGQKAKEEMLSTKKAIQRFESVRTFQEYGLDVLRVEFLRGYRSLTL